MRRIGLLIAVVVFVLSLSGCEQLIQEEPEPPEPTEFVRLDGAKISGINSVWLVYVDAAVTNVSDDKTIKYAYVDVTVYNAVDDKLYEDIDGSSTQTLEVIGPLDPGEQKQGTWEIGYFTSADHVEAHIEGVELMNGDSYGYTFGL